MSFSFSKKELHPHIQTLHVQSLFFIYLKSPGAFLFEFPAFRDSISREKLRNITMYVIQKLLKHRNHPSESTHVHFCYIFCLFPKSPRWPLLEVCPPNTRVTFRREHRNLHNRFNTRRPHCVFDPFVCVYFWLYTAIWKELWQEADVRNTL